MSPVRPPASDGPSLVVWAALSACLTGVVLTALGILDDSLTQVLAGVSLAGVSLGVAAGMSRRARDGGKGGPGGPMPGGPLPGGALPADAGLRLLMAAVALIVGVFALAVTAAVAGTDSAAARSLVRATAWVALSLSFGTLGFAWTMVRDAQGRHRPDWVFVGIAALLIAVTLWQLQDRLGLIFFVD
jgi:hypothetical protein